MRARHLDDWLFAAAGVLATLVVFDGDRAAHLGFVAAALAMVVVGGWIEERLGLGGGSDGFSFHRLALGQIAFLTWFYLRSLSCELLHLPGVSGVELYALAVFAAWDRTRRPLAQPKLTRAELARRGLILTAWWVSTLIYVGLRSGRLATPSSDPDLHVFYAKLTALAGRVVYDQQPYAEVAVDYASAFSSLNAVWLFLSRASVVQVVNCQIALQSGIAVGLAVEAIFALRRGTAVVAGLLVIVFAHLCLALPVNTAFPCFEGTPRLSHKAMEVLPFTFALRVTAARGGPWLRWLTVVAVGAFALAFAVVTNPSLGLLELPILVAALLVAAVGIRGGGPDLPARRLRWLALLILIPPLLATGGDAWVRARLQESRLIPAASPAASNARAAAPTVERTPLQALQAGAGAAVAESWLGVVPSACLPSSQCPETLGGARALWPEVFTLLALLALVALRKSAAREAAVAVLAMVAALWILSCLRAAVLTWLVAPKDQYQELLRNYTDTGARGASALFCLLLVAVSLALLQSVVAHFWHRSPSLVDAASSGAVALAVLIAIAAWPGRAVAIVRDYEIRAVHAPDSNLGPILPGDLEFVRQLDELVPPDERVLLLGYTVTNAWEEWNFAYGPTRALPFYGRSKFAFFHGTSGFPARLYDEHVCNQFDLPWLAAHDVRWVFYSDEAFWRNGYRCPRNWMRVRDEYFEEVLRSRDRVLYRLRADKLEQAAHDPALGL